MVWLPSNELNLHLQDNELVQYKAAIIGTKNTKGTDGKFWSRVLGAVYYDYSLENKTEKDPAKYEVKTWKDNPVEVVRRCWEW